MEFPKKYDAKETEKKWQKWWEENKIFKFNLNSKKPIYSIDTPPPYASAGHLHIGHALHYTQFEIIARYKRMAGFNVYFAPCFDNNGLPTEKYVEEKYKISKKDITRAKFRKLCLEESRKVEKTYANNVFRALGHSYDWDLLYTTIDPEAQKVSQTSFLDLYKKGNAYRGEEPTIWCTHHQTALAQAEVEDLERTTTLYYIDFDLEKGGKINVATTRPEFLPACVGIFVNPNDKRYSKLIGKSAIVPLFNQKVKIMADEKVDINFGSGIVMICTFGDTTDIEWWKKHKLDLKMLLTKDGKLNELAGKYKGKTIKEGRAAIVSDLEKEKRITNSEQIHQTVGACWRCGTPVEFIVTKQWFIKTLKYKKELIKQGRKINWHPKFYRTRYEDWTNNLGWDWCISRQRFYGVPIPVWYCKKCNRPIMPDEKDLPVDPTEDKPKKKCKCGSSDFEPEKDVFDTWMTSSMTPEIAARWLEKPDQFKKIFPMSLRPQSHDIIRTWAFYTILKSFLHFNEIPWKDIMIGTFVLDSKGKGMHKSKGNAIWIHELLDKFNVDTVRYWVGTAAIGEDLPFKEKDLITGNRFLIKVWNASRFAISHLQDFDSKKPAKLEAIDKYLLLKLNKITEKTKKQYDEYKISEAKKSAEQFFWHMFCDNYLEIAKDRLYNPDKRGNQARASAQYTLYQILLTILKLIAPIVPHISEEIYSLFYKEKEKCKSIHISDFPKQIKITADEKAGDIIIEIISEVRKFKTQKQMSLKKELSELIIETDANLEPFLEDLKSTTHAKTISVKKAKELKIEIKE